jgi:hypothetical protein
MRIRAAVAIVMFGLMSAPATAQRLPPGGGPPTSATYDLRNDPRRICPPRAQWTPPTYRPAYRDNDQFRAASSPAPVFPRDQYHPPASVRTPPPELPDLSFLWSPTTVFILIVLVATATTAGIIRLILHFTSLAHFRNEAAFGGPTAPRATHASTRMRELFGVRFP